MCAVLWFWPLQPSSVGPKSQTITHVCMRWFKGLTSVQLMMNYQFHKRNIYNPIWSVCVGVYPDFVCPVNVSRKHWQKLWQPKGWNVTSCFSCCQDEIWDFLAGYMGKMWSYQLSGFEMCKGLVMKYSPKSQTSTLFSVCNACLKSEPHPLIFFLLQHTFSWYSVLTG